MRVRWTQWIASHSLLVKPVLLSKVKITSSFGLNKEMVFVETWFHQISALTSTIQLVPRSVCAPVASSTTLCYRATLMYNGIIIDTQTNLNFNTCPVTTLSSFLGSGVSIQLDGEVTNGTVSHLTTATLSCSAIHDLIGSPQITCIDGSWEPAGLRHAHVSCMYYSNLSAGTKQCNFW